MTKKITSTEPRIVGPFVAAWPSLFEVNEMSGRYELTMIYARNSATHKTLNEMCEEAIRSRWGDDRPSDLLLAINDGNDKKNNREGGTIETPYYLIDKLYTKIKTVRPPRVTDADNKTIVKDGVLTSGDICIASVSVYPYDNAADGKAWGKRGLWVTLHGVRKLRDGAPIGSNVNIQQVESSLSNYDASSDDEDF
jgi:hypothetical protein